MSKPRTIIVMRHSKAEQGGPSDFERQLTHRGAADAAEAGAWLAERVVVPDEALVSSAVRAQQTWEALADVAGWDLEPDLEDAMYSAGWESTLDLVRGVPGHVQTLVVVGHNPTMASLAQLLDDGEGDQEAGTQLAGGYPTSAVTVFSFDGDWADLDEASATLRAYHVGRG